MSVKTNHHLPDTSYFCTFTCNRWMNLFEITNCYDEIYKWFNIMVELEYQFLGYVIMPNHLHATIAFRKTNKSINKIIGDGKRFIGYEIIKRLNENKQYDLLRILENAVNRSDKKRGKLHEVWEDSFDWKAFIGSDFTLQKLNYMHLNPCTGKCPSDPVIRAGMLAANPFEYEHSSARFYISGEQGIYEILNFGELDDLNLSIPS